MLLLFTFIYFALHDLLCISCCRGETAPESFGGRRTLRQDADEAYDHRRKEPLTAY